MTSTPDQHEFEMVIASDMKAAVAIRDRILGLLESNNYSERDVFCVRLALEEALINAVKHGNRLDPQKTVRIGCSVCTRLARIEIEDGGTGFCPADVPDPTQNGNLERPGGRGVLLMRSMMNSVEFSERGNLVVMEKLREPCSTPASA